MRAKIKTLIEEVMRETFQSPDIEFSVVPGENAAHGDYASNIAFVCERGVAKQMNSHVSEVEGIRGLRTPRQFAEKLKGFLDAKAVNFIDRIEIVGPGFLNFWLKDKTLLDGLEKVLEHPDTFGTSDVLHGKTVMVEYTDPNPFKQFHIGHLMSNAIGESIARLYEAGGAKVLRVNWQGDIGMHIAMAVWGMGKGQSYLGPAYAAGATAYRTDPEAKEEIEAINRKIYDRSDPEISELYQEGRQGSLDYFEKIYARLGTKFIHYFFESEMGPKGMEIVRQHPEVFESSDNAVVFKGEPYGLHTRVFINSQGLPTYEAKELGLNQEKFKLYHPDLSLIVTGNEITEYFKVLLKAMELVMPGVAERTRHIPHGMLRLSSGKMSSRTGDVITAEWLIQEVQNRLPKDTDESVALASIKYSILKQNVRSDIIFDFDKSAAFQGDSGPYLQYTHARLKSILRKAKVGEIKPPDVQIDAREHCLAATILRLSEVIEDALKDCTPNTLANYLFSLAQLANEFYHSHPVMQESDEQKKIFRLVLITAVASTLKKGLHLLGIDAPEEM